MLQITKKEINIKFRSSFIEQISKLMDCGMFDVAIPCTKGKEEVIVPSTILMDKKLKSIYRKTKRLL